MPDNPNFAAIQIARRLRLVMIARKMTSADIVRSTTMGSGQISEYLNGKRMMRVDRLLDLCDALDCSADYLLGISNNPNRRK